MLTRMICALFVSTWLACGAPPGPPGPPGPKGEMGGAGAPGMDAVAAGWTLRHLVNFAYQACPAGWTKDPAGVVCARKLAGSGTMVAVFPMDRKSYSEVLIKATVSIYSSADAFADTGRGANPTVRPDVPYADGVGFFAGEQHLFTLTSGYSNVSSCTCAAKAPPVDVGQDFYCLDQSTAGVWTTVFDRAPFQKRLPLSTNSDIKVALMADQGMTDEDVGIRELEIWTRP